MQNTKKVLLVGPLIPPVHGQSLAFTRLEESIQTNEKTVINTNLEGKPIILKVLFTFKILFLILIRVLFCKYDTVYFTCSRSFLGSIKDVFLINLVSLKKIKVINHLHGSDFYTFLHASSNWYKKILFYSYNKVHTSIVLLPIMKDQFQDFKNMKVEVVSNFYDEELQLELVQKEKDKLNLVYLSNIMSSKGIFELVEAFVNLSKRYDNIYLNIAGSYLIDEKMSMYELQNKFLNVISGSDRINYLGQTFGQDKIKLLQSSDIFVLPSYYKSEAFPISIIEAMVCQNAIVTTNYRYLPEVVHQSNGVLVEPKSVKSLEDGIESLINDRNKLEDIQVHNKKEAKAKYSLEQYIDSVKKIILEK